VEHRAAIHLVFDGSLADPRPWGRQEGPAFEKRKKYSKAAALTDHQKEPPAGVQAKRAACGELMVIVTTVTRRQNIVSRVTYGMLSRIASLHRKDEDCAPFIKCVLDEELREIQFPREGLRTKFVA
jgi:hypothetical protein